MIINKLSPKQRQIFKFINDNEYALICDGAVRSGKTISMIAAFVMWAMDNFDNTNFAICGKTVQSAERNLLNPLMQIEGLPYKYKYKISTKTLFVSLGRKSNTFYFFGGKDESSYALIQGLTLAGVLFDEVALMPQSFVDQAIARTLSFANAKLWFNCNPDSPNHWFYKNWIENQKDSTKHIHFLMSDNPIMTEKEIAKAEQLYTGVFYDKYIKGLWVRAEGIIFTLIAENKKRYLIDYSDIVKDKNINGNIKKEYMHFKWVECGFDIGGNGSAYSICCTALGYDNKLYVLKATKKQAPDLPFEDVEKFTFDFIDEVESKYNIKIRNVNTDHVDVIINTLNQKRYIFGKTYKPPLEDRVFLYSTLMAQDRLIFVDGECDDLIDELQNIVYNEKEEKAIPLDDGTMQIDTYDSFTYSIAGNWSYLTD